MYLEIKTRDEVDINLIECYWKEYALPCGLKYEVMKSATKTRYFVRYKGFNPAYVRDMVWNFH